MTTDRIAHTNVQPATRTIGSARSGSVNSLTKLANPTLTAQPAGSAVPSSATKLPLVGRTWYTVPVAVSVIVCASASQTSVDM